MASRKLSEIGECALLTDVTCCCYYY